MTDKPYDVGLDNKSQSEKDIIDFNHELAGGEHGRIKRFSAETDSYLNADSAKSRKERERKYTDMLTYWLSLDAQYRALYLETQDMLDDAQDRVDDALLNIKIELDDIKQRLDNADKLGLSDEQRLELERRRDELRLHQQEIQDYQRDVIHDIRQRMDDKNEPPSKDDMRRDQQRINDDMPQLLKAYSPASQNPDISVSQDVVGALAFSEIKLSEDFKNVNSADTSDAVVLPVEPNFEPLSIKI